MCGNEHAMEVQAGAAAGAGWTDPRRDGHCNVSTGLTSTFQVLHLFLFRLCNHAAYLTRPDRTYLSASSVLAVAYTLLHSLESSQEPLSTLARGHLGQNGQYSQ